MLPAPPLSPCDEDARNHSHGLGCSVCGSAPTEGTHESLVRRALVAIASARLLGCVRRVAQVARTADEWEDVSNGFDLLELAGTERPDLKAARDAAARMRVGDLDGAIAALASFEGLSSAAWIASRTRGGAR